ncbi:MAG: hypothetical protein ACRCUZ_13505 [Shewanella sp.]
MSQAAKLGGFAGAYPKNVRDSIIPLSVSNCLPAAFDEWAFLGNVRDFGRRAAICQLCGQESLRYRFEIENSITRAKLWVGSSCILKFGVPIFEGARKLSEIEARKKLASLTQNMQQDSCISALETIASKEESKILSSALDYYRRNGCLTPKFAFVVLWRLNKANIDYIPSFFKVELKRLKHREDLMEMEPGRVSVIWPALSASQRAMAIRLGHAEPVK